MRPRQRPFRLAVSQHRRHRLAAEAVGRGRRLRLEPGGVRIQQRPRPAESGLTGSRRLMWPGTRYGQAARVVGIADPDQTGSAPAGHRSDPLEIQSQRGRSFDAMHLGARHRAGLRIEAVGRRGDDHRVAGLDERAHQGEGEGLYAVTGNDLGGPGLGPAGDGVAEFLVGILRIGPDASSWVAVSASTPGSGPNRFSFQFETDHLAAAEASAHLRPAGAGAVGADIEYRLAQQPRQRGGGHAVGSAGTR